jgi:hypothetical protein
MIWINKDNTKPLYLLSIESLLTQLYSTDNIEVSKTKDILLFSVNGSTATLVKGSVNDKEHLMHRELLGVEILYESEKPSMFAILFNNTRIIASDKKILLDTVITILMKKEKEYFNDITRLDTLKLVKTLYTTELRKMYRYFKTLHEKLKEI